MTTLNNFQSRRVRIAGVGESGIDFIAPLGLNNPMNVPLVMTIIGPDRTGLVEQLADLVALHGGNWMESRMAHLGGKFAGILRVHVPAEHEQALVAALKGLQTQGLSVVASSDREAAPETRQEQATIEIVGHDRPGIVRQISRVLAQHRINVEELNTECTSAPMSGEMLFKAEVLLHIPASCPVAELRADLEKIAQELMVDIKLADVG
jgi:glycine cleavage system regulatory protein